MAIDPNTSLDGQLGDMHKAGHVRSFSLIDNNPMLHTLYCVILRIKGFDRVDASKVPSFQRALADEPIELLRAVQ